MLKVLQRGMDSERSEIHLPWLIQFIGISQWDELNCNWDVDVDVNLCWSRWIKTYITYILFKCKKITTTINEDVFHNILHDITLWNLFTVTFGAWASYIFLFRVASNIVAYSSHNVVTFTVFSLFILLV